MPEAHVSDDGMSEKGFPSLIRKAGPKNGDGGAVRVFSGSGSGRVFSAIREVEDSCTTDQDMDTESDVGSTVVKSRKRKNQGLPEFSLHGSSRKDAACNVNQMEDSLIALERWLSNVRKKATLYKDSKAKFEGGLPNLRRVSSDMYSNLYYLEGKADGKMEVLACMEELVRKSIHVPVESGTRSFSSVLKATPVILEGKLRERRCCGLLP